MNFEFFSVNWRRLFLILIFVLLFSLQFVFYLNKHLEPDESYFIFVSGEFLKGKIPYKDYVSDPKMPGMYYALGSLFLFTGTSVFTSRLFLFTINALAAVALYFLAEKIHKGSGKFAFLFYLAAVLIPPFAGYNVISEPFVVLFTAAALHFLFSRSPRYLFISGLLGGVAVVFKQVALFFAAAAAAYFLLEYMNRKLSFVTAAKNFTVFIIGFLLAPLMSVLHFYSLGALDEMIYWTFTVPSGFAPAAFSPVVALVHGSFFFAIWLLGALRVAALKPVNSAELTVFFLGILFLSPWFLVQFGHYLLPVAALASVLASVYIARKASMFSYDLLRIFTRLKPGFSQSKALEERSSSRSRRSYASSKTSRKPSVSYNEEPCKVLHVQHERRSCLYPPPEGGRETSTDKFLLVLAVVFVLTLSVNVYSESKFQNATGSIRDSQLGVAEFIRNNTQNDGDVYVFGYDPSVYLLSSRRPPVKSFHVYGPFLLESEDEVIEALKSVKYAVMISDCNIRPRICSFIVDNFIFETDIGGRKIYSNLKQQTAAGY